MSMRDQVSEESSVGGHSKVGLAVGLEVSCSSAHSSPQAPNAPTALESTRCNSSPLLRIFASKEIVPKVLEYEKAILVMKEHDYAKKEDRAEVGQLSGLLEDLADAPQEKSNVSEEVSDPVSIIMSLRKEIHDFRDSLARNEDGLITSQLRDLVSMHVELIREQQEQLQDKDKELSTVRKDKEQLEARLERMERRLAISQKRAQSRYDNSELDSSLSHSHYHHHHQQSHNAVGSEEAHQPLTAVPKLEPQLDVATLPTTTADRQPRSRSSSNDRVNRSRRRVPSHSGTPAPQEVPVESPAVTGISLATTASVSTKRSSKRRIPATDTPSKQEPAPPKKKKSKQTELRTKVEYTPLNLPLHKPSRRATAVEYSAQNSMSSDGGIRNHGDGVGVDGDALGSQSTSSCSASSVHGSDMGQSLANGVEDVIVVPSWRTRTFDTTEMTDGDSVMEDLSEESFLKRHKRPEEDEKRRKRWDMQRARTLWNHEELKKKYEQKSGEKPEKKKEKMTSFLPKLSEVEVIEVRDTVAVSAFGMPLPVVKPKDFELPWLDMESREFKDRHKTPRSKSKSSGHRSSVSSQVDENGSK